MYDPCDSCKGPHTPDACAQCCQYGSTRKLLKQVEETLGKLTSPRPLTTSELAAFNLKPVWLVCGLNLDPRYRTARYVVIKVYGNGGFLHFSAPGYEGSCDLVDNGVRWQAFIAPPRTEEGDKTDAD